MYKLFLVQSSVKVDIVFSYSNLFDALLKIMELRSGKIVSELKINVRSNDNKHQCAVALKLLQHRTEYFIKQLDHIKGNLKEKEKIRKHIELCKDLLVEGKRTQISLERIQLLHNSYKATLPVSDLILNIILAI